jgi:hypothetical protein
MSDKSIELRICPKCGSTEYLENYPAPGTTICSICAHEIIKITLKETDANFSLKDNCPYCGKGSDESEIFYAEGLITVYKCKGCEKLDGYLELAETFYCDEMRNDGDYSGKAAAIAEVEGSQIFSASKCQEFVKTLHEKEKDPQEICRKQFNALVSKKHQTMQMYGVESETIHRATRELTYFIESKGPFTGKQLQSLLSAAIDLSQDDLIRMRKFKGNKITKRQMERIFGIDNKTTQKWKNILKENRKPLRLIIRAHQINEQFEEDLWAEIPKEIKSVSRLEKPRKGKCDCCGQIKFLNWRINYANESWSDACEDDYDSLKTCSLKHEWKIESIFPPSRN